MGMNLDDYETQDVVLTDAQKTAIRCAHADLVGALQARNQMDIEVHDWEAHKLSAEELEEAFPALIEESARVANCHDTEGC